MNNSNIDKFILGVFFMLYGTFAYAIAGNTLKYISLFTGFILLTSSADFFKTLRRYKPIIFIRTLIFFSFYVLLSLLLNQQTFNGITIIFDLICLILFISGYFLAKNIKMMPGIKNSTKQIILILTILGSYYLFQFQSISRDGLHSRDLGDEFLNANGIAYITAQMLILLIWLLRLEKTTLYKIIFTTSIVLLTANLIFTASRGALLFLILTFIISLRSKFRNPKKIIKIVFYSFFASLVLFQVINSSELFSEKIDYILERFNSALNYFNGSEAIDNSLAEREDLQKVFWNNIEQMFFGQVNYKPYPHNQIMEIIMRWGIFGLPIIGISLLTFARSLFFMLKRPLLKSIDFLISMLFIFSYLQSMTSLTLDNTRFLWLGFGFFLVKKWGK